MFFLLETAEPFPLLSEKGSHRTVLPSSGIPSHSRRSPGCLPGSKALRAKFTSYGIFTSSILLAKIYRYPPGIEGVTQLQSGNENHRCSGRLIGPKVLKTRPSSPHRTTQGRFTVVRAAWCCCFVGATPPKEPSISTYCEEMVVGKGVRRAVKRRWHP